MQHKIEKEKHEKLVGDQWSNKSLFALQNKM